MTARVPRVRSSGGSAVAVAARIAPVALTQVSFQCSGGWGCGMRSLLHHADARFLRFLQRLPNAAAAAVAGAVARRSPPQSTPLVDVCDSQDTGGSTRSPALHCGNFGYDPPRGKYSNKGHAALTLTHDQLGFNTRTFECLLVLDAAITGRCEAHMEASARTACQATVRVAFPQEFFINFTLPAAVLAQPQLNTLGLLSCRASSGVRSKLAQAELRLRAASGVQVVAAEWHTVTSPKLGTVRVPGGRELKRSGGETMEASRTIRRS